MNSNLRKQIFISLVIIFVSFGGGFLFGKNGGFKNIQANEKVDMSTFWQVWNTLDEKFVSASSTKKIADQDRMYGAISGMVESMGDPYTVFMKPEQKAKFNESIEGVFEGVGMEIGVKDNYLTVVAPLKDSPAQKAGIEKGDIILKIDDKDSSNMKVEEAVSYIRGPKNTIVTLSVLKKTTGEPVEIKITRDKIIVPTMETEVIGDVYVIRLYSFGANATAEFKTAIQQFAKTNKNKLILDMRGNPGGYMDAAVDISSWFLPAGKTIVTEDFGSSKDVKIFRSKGYELLDLSKLKMIVMIDEGSASASEIVAGALSEQGVAKLVGMKSFGKGSVQELFEVTPETVLKVTIARWLTPNGNSISFNGLKPDTEVKFDVDLFKKYQKDSQLLKAIELLK